MSLELQWWIIVPLITLFVGVVWLAHSREVRTENRQGEVEPEGAHVCRVIAKFEISDWSALALAAIYVTDLAVRTIQA